MNFWIAFLNLTFVCPCIVSIIVNDDQQDATILAYLFIPNPLYMFRAMSSPIIRSTWLYLQLLRLSINIAASWCHEWDGTEFHLIHDTTQQQYWWIRWNICSILSMTPAGSNVDGWDGTYVPSRPWHQPASILLPAGGLDALHPDHQPATSSVHYTTSCKHSLMLLKMGVTIARNMLS